MQQAPSPLNPWLLSYILQNYKSHSRYEIDSYLIAAGYNPTDIEATWQAILSNNYQRQLVDTRKFLRKPDYIKVIGFIFVLLMLLLFCVIFAVSIGGSLLEAGDDRPRRH